jgi:Fur family ferric uptake transcriptional regulator
MERRNTKQKQGVINVLKTHDMALSADEVIEKLNLKMSRVTVYRILERFEQEGIAHRVVGLEGKNYFALCSDCDSEHHHDSHAHFQCRECKSLRCVDVEVIRPRLSDVKIEECRVLLTGLCETCGN